MVMTEQPESSESPQWNSPEETWWALNGAWLLKALDRVAEGMSPAEVYTRMAECCSGLRDDF